MTTSKKRILSVLKIIASLGLALLLFWYLYKDNFSDTLQGLKHVNYFWVLVSIGFGLTAHWIRAYRWKLLLEPTGHHPTLVKCLVALFIGYLVNLAVPRLGEISRCLVLRRTDQIPVTSSLGTVISERVLDVFMLLIITGITVLIEFDKLNEFFTQIFLEKLSGVFTGAREMILIAVSGILVLLVIWLILRKRIINSSWWFKMKTLFAEAWYGFISITKLRKPGVFWAATLGIWVIYYFMSFVVFFSMDSTADLGWKAGLSLLVMGGIAMSAPVQGGIGAYHLLVSGLLVYYGVGHPEGLSFAFLLHSSQMVLMIVAGIVSGLALFLWPKKANTA